MPQLLQIPDPRPERPRRQTRLETPWGDFDLRASFPFEAAPEVPALHLYGTLELNRIEHLLEVELTPAVDRRHMVVRERRLSRRQDPWRNPTDNAYGRLRQLLDELGLWLSEWLEENGQWLYEERLARLEDEADFLAQDVRETAGRLQSALELLAAHETAIARQSGTAPAAPVGVRQRLSQLGS